MLNRTLTKMGVLKALAAAGVLLAISFLGHPAQAQPSCPEIGAVPGIIYGQPSATCYAADVDSNHALKVTGSFTPSGTGDVNLVGINGVAPVTGSGTATAALRVELPTNGTGQVGATLNPSATVGITTQSCTVACASTIVSGAHSAYGISGSATVAGWILVYDATSCAANGTVTPKKAYAYTVANSTIGISWADIPMANATGIAVCFSSTGPFTATASTTAFLSLDYK